MFVMILMLLPFIGILAFMWNTPFPINMKMGLSMLIWAFAMLITACIWWIFATIRGIYREIIKTSNSNCLVWRHPEQKGSTELELAYYASKEDLVKESALLQKRLISWFWKLVYNGEALKKRIKEIDKLLKQEAWVAMTGADWYYKYLFFMPEKRLKWVYEEKQKDGSFVFLPYDPDKEITELIKRLEKDKGPGLPTTGKLAYKLDWRAAKRRLAHPKKFIDQLQVGAIIAMPVVCLFGIMFLLDMLNANPGG